MACNFFFFLNNFKKKKLIHVLIFQFVNVLGALVYNLGDYIEADKYQSKTPFSVSYTSIVAYINVF